ncbi:hypothetical protein HNQ80_004034 [Anaerosolibacter carboniphilus]|uniref:Uncharacterized protein n=1 Tax=Anaerosolibacter carboniphilus TaxID=1417629 RepID=A0A841KZZ8_9FIRM|nr:hypothetical protein [Anaerosolibacter carboniphilus]MBB6217898.1 hypothetical protein [Anaerosolibacter carboniphilus]
MNEKKTQHSRDTAPTRNFIGFKWGGTTTEWEEEADQFMNCLQDQLDANESDATKEKKIEYGKQKQYW